MRLHASVVLRGLCLLGLLLPWFRTATAQNATPRITEAVDNGKRVTLTGNVHPLAQARYDQGAAPGSMATGRIMLVLQRSGAQETALKQYLGDLQNPNSPSYRNWLTPAQFGELYGISDTDLATVTAWLESQGFTVDKVPRARNVVIFSGNFAQIQQAFHTSTHRYLVNGETHFANSTDPQIPAALAPVVAGIATLNDFRPRPYAIKGPRGHYDADTKTIEPDLTLQNSSGQLFLFVDPADAATIYDTPNAHLNANYKSGVTYDGSGVTIGIAGDSNIVMQDIINYRTGFLGESSSSVNTPNVIVDGNDPGVNGAAVEALLDNEVAGGIAPGAKINFYTAADTDLQSGLFLAIYRALDDNGVNILNVSYGACEAAQGVSGNLQVLEAWEQAAAQGISVTVSAGDSGSAGCDADRETVATYGLAVSGLASTPYNIAVGGTDFDVLSAGLPFASFLSPSSTYVKTSTGGSAPYYGTALKYVPENPWNDSANLNAALTPSTSGYSDNTPVMVTNSSGQKQTIIAGGGGGVSSVYSQPAFQAKVTTYPGARALPDVSFLASNGTFGATWVVCADSVSNGDTSSTYTDCQNTNGTFASGATFAGVGGTSASSPAFAAILALVSQSQGDVRLGQVDYVLYNLAGQSALYATVFHDITAGNNSVYCENGSPNCGTNSFLDGYNAATGYDAATGLGSVDVNQLISNWSKAIFTPTTTSFAINGSRAAVSATHGQSLTFAATVTPGTASGDVAIINSSNLENNNSIGFLTLLNGSASQSSNALPGGSYTVYAYYGGDVKDAASQSNGIPVDISAEPSTTILQVAFYDPLTGAPESGTSQPYGLFSSASAKPYGTAEGNNSSTPATGTINFVDSAGALPNGSNVAIASDGIASYNNFVHQNQSFTAGSHSVTAQYGGDPSYGPSTSSAVAFRITQAPTVTTIQANSTSGIALTATVNTNSLGNPPTGTVTFFKGTTRLGSPVVVSGGVNPQTGLAQATAALKTAQLPVGQDTVTAQYSGDPNYTASTSQPTTVTVSSGFSLSSNPAAVSIAAAGQSGTSTITVTGTGGFAGSLSFTCGVSPVPVNDPPTCFVFPFSAALNATTTSATATLQISTIASLNSGLRPADGPNKPGYFAASAAIVMACVFLLGAQQRRRWDALLGLIVVVFIGLALTSCASENGGSSKINLGTPAGNYTVTVTATSGSTAQSTTVSVSVQ
jgi:trimeric autotransporter adhesin